MNNIIFIFFVVILILAILVIHLQKDPVRPYNEGFEDYVTTPAGDQLFGDQTRDTTGGGGVNMNEVTTPGFFNIATDQTTAPDTGETSAPFYGMDQTTAPDTVETSAPFYGMDQTTAPDTGETTAPFYSMDQTTAPVYYTGETTAPLGDITTPGYMGETTTPGYTGETTTPGATNGPPVDCQYEWTNWGACNLDTGLVTRTINTVPPQNGGATCTKPPSDAATSINCLKALTFSSRLIGWKVLYNPANVRQMPYLITVYNMSSNAVDSYGFTKPPFKTNYARVRFDNTNGDYSSLDSATITLQTSIPNLAPGFYLMTYYVQSRIADNDAQSISITAGVNQTSNTTFQFRTVDEQGYATTLVNPGLWTPQTLSFEVTETDPASSVVQFVFNLFDTQTTSDNMVAIGGIRLQSCGNAPCNIDCTYIYGDWSYCDFNTGKSTRTIATIPPVNNGATCETPSPDSVSSNCFDPFNLPSTNLKDDRWNVIYSKPAIAKNVKMLVTSPSIDTTGKIYNEDITFSGPYTIVEMDNTDGALTPYTNPYVVMSTNLRLAPGNYRFTYYIQSSYTSLDTQGITINGIFGTTKKPFNFRNMVAPGVWFPMAMEFTVTDKTKQPVPISFQFVLIDRKKVDNAVAIGGMNMISCGEDPCITDCQYVWDNWQDCDETGMTWRDPIVITNPENGGMECPMRDVSNCSVIPKDCQYTWGDWSTCVPGNPSRTRTQITRQPVHRGKLCSTPQTETANDCTMDCQYNGWSDWSTCQPGSTTRTRVPNTIAPAYGGATCTPGVESSDDCPLDCQQVGWGEWSTCTEGSTRRTRMPITSPPLNDGSTCTPGVPEVADDCQNNCSVSFVSDRCDGTNQKYYRTYFVQKKSLNQTCTIDDEKFGKITIPNQLGNQETEVGKCNDCTISKTNVGCYKGNTQYSIDDITEATNGGKACTYVDERGQTITISKNAPTGYTPPVDTSQQDQQWQEQIRQQNQQDEQRRQERIDRQQGQQGQGQQNQWQQQSNNYLPGFDLPGMNTGYQKKNIGFGQPGFRQAFTVRNRRI